MSPPDRHPLFTQLRPVLGSRLKQMEMAWVTGSPPERREIEIALELLREELLDRRSALLEPPAGDQASGPVRLGTIRHGRRRLRAFGLRHSELLQHTLVLGRSGSGKSNLVHAVLLQLMRQGIPWIVTDHKRSTRHLLSHADGADIRCYALGRDFGAALRFNPLMPPPGVPFEANARQVVELICDTFTGGDAVFAVLTRAIESVHRLGSTPTLRDVRRVIASSEEKGRAAPWRQTTLRILDELCFGATGTVLNGDGNDDVERLLSGHTILELDGLSRQHASFVAQLILRDVHYHLLDNPVREQLRLLVCLEEAHELAPHRASARETVIETVMRQGREAGCGLFLATQSPTTISTVVLANCDLPPSFSPKCTRVA